MRILLTNDDGIFAEGLCALHDALCGEHQVIIVAPEAERSAVGHAITIADPLRVRKIKRNNIFFGYAVSGTPADCVKLALYEIVNGKVDLVLSGINRGANVGINVLYSGTVSAATEGAILGYPSIAVSLNEYLEPDYCFAAYFTSCLIEFLAKNGFPKNICLNVNIPAIPAHQIKGIKCVRQSTKPLIEKFEKRIDPHGNIYYWQCSEKFIEEDPDTDVVALKEGFITITPLYHNLTSFEILAKIKSWNIEF
ncbi:5'/3'-nucleotidase SurE [Thermodesulfatator atlanticus]